MQSQSKFAKVGHSSSAEVRLQLLQLQAVGVAEEEDQPAEGVAQLVEEPAHGQIQQAEEKEREVGEDVEQFQAKQSQLGKLEVQVGVEKEKEGVYKRM